MREFEIELKGKKYPVCCGLRTLSKFQKKYGSLNEFEQRIAPDDLKETDIDALIDTLKIMAVEGARMKGADEPTEEELFNSASLVEVQNKVFEVYMESMIPSDVDEKN